MYDRELVCDILYQIRDAVHKVNKRFEPVKVVDDFTNTPEGMEKLDSICMLLIAVGESLNNIDKITNKSLLKQYPEIDWKGAKGLRDIISHQYFDIDAEEISLVYKKHMPPLLKTVNQMISSIQ